MDDYFTSRSAFENRSGDHPRGGPRMDHRSNWVGGGDSARFEYDVGGRRGGRGVGGGTGRFIDEQEAYEQHVRRSDRYYDDRVDDGKPLYNREDSGQRPSYEDDFSARGDFHDHGMGRWGQQRNDRFHPRTNEDRAHFDDYGRYDDGPIDCFDGEDDVYGRHNDPYQSRRAYDKSGRCNSTRNLRYYSNDYNYADGNDRVASQYHDDSEEFDLDRKPPALPSRAMNLKPPPVSASANYTRPGAQAVAGPPSIEKRKIMASGSKSLEVFPGVYMRLRGADETWAAVQNDYYVPCECFCCNITIFCILDADYVLCPECKVINPIGEGISEENQSDGGVGLGFTYDDLAKWQAEMQGSNRYHAKW